MALFDDAQDISQAAGTVASTNILDWVNDDLEMGAGEPVWLNVRIAEVVASATTNATLAVALCYDSVAPIDSSSTVIYTTPAIAEASLTAGAWVLRMPLPVNVDEDNIMGLLYTIGTATTTTGTVNAWLDHGPQSSYDTQVSTSNI
jgi:hypothetical protein